MKAIIFLLLGLQSLAAWSGEVNDFNHALIEGVKKDIQADNDEDLKTKASPGRKPASVAPVEAVEVEQPQPKIEKLKQLGTPKW